MSGEERDGRSMSLEYYERLSHPPAEAQLEKTYLATLIDLTPYLGAVPGTDSKGDKTLSRSLYFLFKT